MRYKVTPKKSKGEENTDLTERNFDFKSEFNFKKPILSEEIKNLPKKITIVFKDENN